MGTVNAYLQCTFKSQGGEKTFSKQFSFILKLCQGFLKPLQANSCYEEEGSSRHIITAGHFKGTKCQDVLYKPRKGIYSSLIPYALIKQAPTTMWEWEWFVGLTFSGYILNESCIASHYDGL